NKEGLSAALINIGTIYLDRGEPKKAMEYFTKSLKIKEEVGHKGGVATALINIGEVYKTENDLNKAMEYFLNGLKIFQEIGSRDKMAVSTLLISETYMIQNKYDLGLAYAKEGLNIAQKAGIPKHMRDAYNSLYKAYKHRGDLKRALKMHELYMEFKDSLNSEQNSKAFLQQEYKYKYEKEQAIEKAMHQEQMALSAEREKRQQVISYSTGGGLMMVALFAFFIYNRLKVTKKQKVIIQQKNEHITESIRYAKRIQDASLTSKEYIDKALDDYFIYFKPKDIVSGDFYWVHKLKDEKVMIAIADCTGHGVPGGFMSMMSTSLLNEIIIENGITQVNMVLDTMRTQLIKGLHQYEEKAESMDGLDIALILIDKKNKEIEFAGAGHKIYIAGNGGCKEIKGDYYPVGYLFGKEKPFSLKKLQLNDDESIYLTSDGYIDQFNHVNRKKFGREGFKQLLISMIDKPMTEQKDIIDKTIVKWTGNIEQIDDILVMGIRF
ncbi:MAG TPA: tetratricopeptide repeat protein, partial [Flavobacteriales bacterium]|nr:tetratricopeptide repeat protein [Flavobacteriales bacterium]